jgi:hypothetical protein
MANHHYGPRSLERLGTCHELLKKLMLRVGESFPTTILEGRRSREQQEKNVAKGVSKTMDSKHLLDPAEAVDAAPDGFSWPSANKLKRRLEGMGALLKPEERAEFDALLGTYVKEISLWYYWAGHVSGVAAELNIPIRQGVDWNGNRKISDQTFDDLPHVELKLPA